MTTYRVGWPGAIAVTIFLAACGGEGSDVAATVESAVSSTATTAGPSPTGGPPPSRSELESPGVGELRDGIPDVDVSKRIVELSDVHFDTFDGRFVPLDQSTIELRRSLLDAIRPLDDPVYDSAADGAWLEPSDLVLGYVAGDRAYAFPHKILNFHEIVNDEFDGVPVLVSYCPLCRSGVVYDRRLGGVTLSFSNTSALYESDLVMVDRETGSYWWQVPGRAIVGTLSGEELQPLPSVTTTWGDWIERFPNTMVLSRNTGSPIDYTRDPFVGYQELVDRGGFAFPVSPGSLDPRLSAGTLVLGIEIGDEQRVYPLELLGAAVVNDLVGGEPVAVFTWDGGGAVFSPVVGGNTLTFSFADGEITDDQTGSTWSRDGRATDGSLLGALLEPLPVRSTFWFAYVGAFPGADVYAP